MATSPKRDDATAAKEAKAAIDAHLDHLGKDDVWLLQRIGISGPSYYNVWSRGSARIGFLKLIASALGMTVPELLSPPREGAPEPAPTTAAEPPMQYGTATLEQRVKAVEQKLAAIAQALR